MSGIDLYAITNGVSSIAKREECARLKGLAIEHAFMLGCDSRAFLDFLTAVFGKPEVKP